MKKLTIGLLLFLLLGAGCRNVSGGKEEKNEQGSQTVHAGQVHELEQAANEVKSIRLFQDARSFSDEVAWVRFNDQWHLIDTKGKLLFSLEKNEHPSTNFANGVAIIDKTKMISKEGRLLCDIKEEGLDQFLVGEDKDGNILGTNSQGYVFAQGVRETVNGTEALLALVDNHGKFAIEPTKEMNVHRYAGDGQFEIGYQDSHRVFYNRDNHKQYQIKDEQAMMDALKFNNNYGVDLLSAKELPLIFDEFGGQKTLVLEGVPTTDISEGLVGIYSDELFYYYCQHQGEVIQGFYNKEGKQIINLAQEKIQTQPYPYFTGGHCLLIYPEEATFTIIDKTGKKMFAAHKGDVKGAEISNGLLRVKQAQDDYYFIDMTGKRILDINGEDYQSIGDDQVTELDVAAFHNDWVRVKAEEKAFFLNAKKEYLTVDFSQWMKK